MKFILGLKLGMSQIFDKEGNSVPVTLIEAGPCYVTQVKTMEKDKYQALQVGFKKIEKAKKIKKTMKGKEYRYLKEIRFLKPEVLTLKNQDAINVSIFQEGEKVSVSGVTKGKGFAGVVKKWGFHGRPSTHGTKHEERTPGSTGGSTPSRVLKGKKMAGRAGADRLTVHNLQLVKIDLPNNILAVRGAVPGRNGILLEIKAK